MDQPGNVVSPARGQLDRENEYSPVPVRAGEFGLARWMGSAVPSRVSSPILHTEAEYGAYSPRDSSRVPRRRLYRHNTPPLGQSRVCRVTQLRTDDLHCRESAGTGPVVLKVVPVTGAAFALHHRGSINVRLSFPTSTIGMKWAC